MSSQAFTLLEQLRDLLAALPGVNTCRIGLEANMTPADYPIVRIVPSGLANGAIVSHRSVDVLVYFGRPVHEFGAGLEALYADLLELEEAIIRAIEGGTIRGQYRDTIADEERIAGYRLMAVRARIEG